MLVMASRTAPLRAIAARRGDHCIALAHEKLISHEMPQSVQGCTDCRLTKADALTGTCNAALLHEGIEYAQQIEIQRSDIHVVDWPDTIIGFPE